MKILYAAMILLSSMPAIADAMFPAGCKPLTFEQKTLLLTAKKPAVILLHNVSKSDVWLTHPIKFAGASAGWNTLLQPKQWTALALKDSSFLLSCVESKPGHEQQIPCAEALIACQWATIQFPAHDVKGTYWAGENMSLNTLIERMKHRGFSPPASTEE